MTLAIYEKLLHDAKKSRLSRKIDDPRPYILMGLSEDGAISFESYKTREEGIARARERWVEQNYQAVDAFYVFNEK